MLSRREWDSATEHIKSNTTGQVEQLKAMAEQEIAELEQQLSALKVAQYNINRELEKKKTAKTRNMVVIRTHTSIDNLKVIEISIRTVDISDDERTIQQFVYKKLGCADKAVIPALLNKIQHDYPFQQIVTNMKLTKQVMTKYKVEETA